MDAYFKARGETHHGNSLMHLKSGSSWPTSYTGLILTASHPNMLWGCYAFLGLGGVPRTQRRPRYRAYALFKNRAWNRWAMHVFILGLNSYN